MASGNRYGFAFAELSVFDDLIRMSAPCPVICTSATCSATSSDRRRAAENPISNKALSRTPVRVSLSQWVIIARTTSTVAGSLLVGAVGLLFLHPLSIVQLLSWFCWTRLLEGES